MYLYISVESKARELESRFFCAFSAAARGWRVCIGRYDELIYFIRFQRLPKGIFFEKSIQPSKIRELDLLKSEGFQVVSQDEESGLLDRSYSDFASRRFSDKTLSRVARNYCWGDFDRQFSQEAYPGHADKFLTVGSPRVDLWRREFLPYYQEETDRITKDFGPFILIPSNFGIIHNIFRSDGALILEKRNGMINNKQEENTFWEIADYQTKLREHFIDMIQHLSSEFPDINIVVRPHPVEHIRHWSDCLPSRNNVHVVRQGGITPWIIASKAVIHNGCTSGFEAVILRKKTLAFRPIRSRHDREIPNLVSVECSSSQAVVQAIGEVMATPAQPSALGKNGDIAAAFPKAVSDRFCNLNGPYAVDRILDDLETISIDAGHDTRSIKPGRATLKARSIAQSLYAKVRGRPNLARHKFSGLDMHEVEGLQRRMSRVRPSLEHLKITHLGSTLYAIE